MGEVRAVQWAGGAADGFLRLLDQTLLPTQVVFRDCRTPAEDEAVCAAIGGHGAGLVRDGAGVLTHCNTGALATAGMGTALAVLVAAHRLGRRFRVYADETRPLLQGARLTAWELRQHDIP